MTLPIWECASVTIHLLVQAFKGIKAKPKDLSTRLRQGLEVSRTRPRPRTNITAQFYTYSGIHVLIGTYIPYSRVSFRRTLSDVEWQRSIQWYEASRGLSVTAELVVVDLRRHCYHERNQSITPPHRIGRRLGVMRESAGALASALCRCPIRMLYMMWSTKIKHVDADAVLWYAKASS